MSDSEVTQADIHATNRLKLSWPNIGRGVSDAALNLSHARHRIAATADIQARVEALEALLRECREELPRSIGVWSEGSEGYVEAIPNPLIARIDATLSTTNKEPGHE